MIERFERFVTSVNQLYRSIQKIKSKEMADMGLQGPHVMCLFQLQQHPEGLTSVQLASLCMEDKAAISRAISKLEEKDLIFLEDNGTKRRYRAVISLTEAGRNLTERMLSLIKQAVSKGGDGLTETEREIFYKALGTIEQNLLRFEQELREE